MIKNKIMSIFGKGILTLLPIYLTVYLIYWLLFSIEKSFGQLLKALFNEWYFPGAGLLTAIGLIFIIGLIMQVYIAQYLSKIVDKLFERVPLVGDIYSSFQSLTKYLSSSDNIQGKDVVMVEVNGMEVLGIVTRTDFQQAPEGIVEDDKMISVYVPMSYQIGGFTLYVPESKTRSVKMKQQAALKWALIGGIDK